MNMIKKGLEWHQEQRHVNCTEVVSINGVSLLASVSECSSFTDSEGVKHQAQYHVFLFRKKDLDLISPLTRGSEIRWEGRKYMVAFDRRQMIEYDDPHQLDIAVHTTERA